MALARFVASSCVFFGLQLRKINPICALLQRMGIFRVEQKNFARKFNGDAGISLRISEKKRKAPHPGNGMWGGGIVCV
jgi:hypothetical protein